MTRRRKRAVILQIHDAIWLSIFMWRPNWNFNWNIFTSAEGSTIVRLLGWFVRSTRYWFYVLTSVIYIFFVANFQILLTIKCIYLKCNNHNLLPPVIWEQTCKHKNRKTGWQRASVQQQLQTPSPALEKVALWVIWTLLCEVWVSPSHRTVNAICSLCSLSQKRTKKLLFMQRYHAVLLYPSSFCVKRRSPRRNVTSWNTELAAR